MAFWNRKQPLPVAPTTGRVDPNVVLNKLAFVEFIDTVDDFDPDDPDELTRAWHLFTERYPDATYASDPNDDAPAEDPHS